MNAKSGLNLTGTLLAVLILACGTAFAASKGSLELQHPTSVAGTKLNTGNYTVRWDGNGDQVELKIYQGKNVVASVPAHVVKMERAPANNSALVNANGDGSYSLSEIRFGGKTFALQIAGEGGSSSSGGASR